MPSEFDQLVRDELAPQWLEQFGERDANGDFYSLRYHDPRKPAEAEPYLWRGVSSETRSTPFPDPTDGMALRETKTWEIERALCDRDGVEECQPNAFVEDFDGEWQINESETVWGPVFVTLGLMREPRVSGNECRVNADL